MSKPKDIYFHVGLGKTGTTFLQDKIFPLFEKTTYIHRRDYHRAKQLAQSAREDRILLSYECDQQLAAVCTDWAKTFPETTPIIVFRRHDGWIASQYRRFAKNCVVRNFAELYDLAENTGRFKHTDLNYRAMITMLEQTFSKPPIILIYDDMRKDREAFIQFIAQKTGTQVDLSKADLSTHHGSYSEHQLKGLMVVSRYINLTNRVVFKNRTLDFIRKLPINGLRYLILYTSKLVPKSWLANQPLIAPEQLKAIKEYWSADWAFVVSRAEGVKQA